MSTLFPDDPEHPDHKPVPSAASEAKPVIGTTLVLAVGLAPLCPARHDDISTPDEVPHYEPIDVPQPAISMSAFGGSSSSSDGDLSWGNNTMDVAAAIARRNRVVALIHARGTSPTRLGSIRAAGLPPWSLRMRLQRFRKWGRLPEAGSPRLVHLSFQMIDLLAQPIVLSLEAIMLALRLVALALGAFRPFSQVFDLTSGPIVQGWVA
jgi:hypothetical protein